MWNRGCIIIDGFIPFQRCLRKQTPFFVYGILKRGSGADGKEVPDRGNGIFLILFLDTGIYLS